MKEKVFKLFIKQESGLLEMPKKKRGLKDDYRIAPNCHALQERKRQKEP